MQDRCFKALKAQCVNLAGISRDVMEERAARRMFLVKVTEDEIKNAVSICQH